MSRLVIVSNRVALPIETRAGGLASAMQAALEEYGGLWFGWSGKVDDDGDGGVRSERVRKIEYALFDLSKEDYREYYLGFANGTLWPLLHYRPSLLDYHRGDFAGYRRVNRHIAARLAPLLRADDIIWVHDYHMIPLAAELRELGIASRIGFFLHVPLPPPALLTLLPHHEQLFPTFAEYDLVGFQTEQDRASLASYFLDELGASCAPGCTVTTASGRRFEADVFPIGIDARKVAEYARKAATTAATRRLVASLEGRKLVIGVDRLDYSKGLTQRFEAFGRFLAQHPAWQARVSFLQIAPPSREEVREYRELRSRLERIAGSINGRYAEPDWVPIRYVNRSFSQATLAGFYRVADIGLVTPLRDGMNLVAKEYVAAQAPDDPGVLILSSFAGAARQMPQAIIINPLDPEDIVESLEQALAMPISERRERWNAMFDELCRNDIAGWRNAFLDRLRNAPAIQSPHLKAHIN